MQDYNWNDLKFILALYRSGRMADAARLVAVNETTIARRIRALERQLGAPIFARIADGRYQATTFGQQIVTQAEMIETQHLRISETAGLTLCSLSGTVRVSAVPVLVNRILVQGFAPFARQHPDLRVEIVPEARNADLTKREADLALRFARPSAGGLQVKTRKLAALQFAVYGPSGPHERADLPWIIYDEANASLPQARWLLAKAYGDISPLRVTDLVTAQEAVAAGLGRSVLPMICAEGDTRLKRCDTGGAPPPDRPLWLLFHADQDQRASVKAVKDWITGINWQGGAIRDA
ncbi:LysR family transcriptional regulator [Ruegeria hyattellae]|uniref:LysR family transcriptional regulator n=1 Tax=Ruegeria hyattellae TaxID=3233337 RepID=UPI00355C9545